MTITALLDANILYSAALRDVFMQLALDGLFRARWSDEIHNEWINALIRNKPTLDRQRLEHIRDLMNETILDATISDYEHLVSSVELPDPDDRHVVAAAIAGECDVIVTKNLADFPASALPSFGVIAISPDEFLSQKLQQKPQQFVHSIVAVRRRLKNPPYSTEEYLEILLKQGLTETVRALSQLISH